MLAGGTVTPQITGSSPQAAAAGGSREQMKRAQSVEVLSILAEASPRPHRAQASTGDEEEEEAEEETFYQASGPPPQESPPPLPPRERDSTPPVLNVLHSSPALVNDSLVLVEKKATTPSSSRSTGKSTSASTVKQKTGAGRQPSPRQPASPRQAPNAKKSSQNRPSAGLLFGVKDKELPAPDTVKETRKLFESGGGTGVGRRFGKSSGGLTKSKSTSSLYTRPNSRSNSQEKPGLGMARKKSEEDLHRSAVTHKSRTGSSPARRTPSSSSSSSSTTRKTPGRVSSPGRTSTSSPAPRPSIPAKPSHLSPSTRPSYRRTASSPSQPPLPARASAPGVVKATPANVVPTTTSKTSNSSSSRPRPVLEEGVKRISQESIENIRSDGNVFNINVDEKTSGAKSHLPGSPQETKYSQPKQVRLFNFISPIVASICSKHRLPPVNYLLQARWIT